MALEYETEVYRARLEELLENEGMFIVIKGDELIGPFETYEDALSGGYGTFGPVSFLVKQIHRVEPIYYFTRDLPRCRS